MNIQTAIFEGASLLKEKYILTSQLDAEILMASLPQPFVETLLEIF